MWGAVIGDIAGSVYEYRQYRKTSLIEVKKTIEDGAFYSDDTILTIAIYDALMHGYNYEWFLKQYGRNYVEYKPNTSITELFGTVFGGNFTKWVNGEATGTSIGNGAMMRISGIGFWFNDVSNVIRNAKNATIPSHNSAEAIENAKIIALIIFYAKSGLRKDEILRKVGIEKIEYIPFKSFNKTCADTIGNCLYAWFTSNNYEEAIRKVISFGGDTDTNACIVGAMAEATYGVPMHLVAKARSIIPLGFSKILDKAYALRQVAI